MYKETHRFTTRDGSWEPSGAEYSITAEDAAKYGRPDFPERGGAVNFFARIEGGPSRRVEFATRTREIVVERELEASGWANIPVEHGSGYDPDQGQTGWWNIKVLDAPSELAEGFGLPHSWHVSSFVVFTWFDDSQDDGGGEGPVPADPPEIPDAPPPTGGAEVSMVLTISEDGVVKTYQLTGSRIGA